MEQEKNRPRDRLIKIAQPKNCLNSSCFLAPNRWDRVTPKPLMAPRSIPRGNQLR